MPEAVVRDVANRCRSGKLKPWEEKIRDKRNLSCEKLGEAIASMIENARKDNEPDLQPVSREVIFKQHSIEKHLAYGEVYVPDEVDTHGDFMTADGIEELAHKFMLKVLNAKIDVMHDNKTGRAAVVESFIAPPAPDWSGLRESLLGVGLTEDFADQAIREAKTAHDDTHPFAPGAWVLGVKVFDEDLWAQIKNGEMTGFSFEAMVRKIPAKVKVDSDGRAHGRTSITNDHWHVFSIRLDHHGNVLSGSTSRHEPSNHVHPITEGLRTQVAAGHRHTFSLGMKISERAA